MLRKLLPIVLFIAAFAITCWGGVGSQTCGNVYNDISDKRGALLAGDTVKSGIAANGEVFRADSARAYAWTCTKHFGSQNWLFMVVGILGVLLAIALFIRAMRTQEATLKAEGLKTCKDCGATMPATALICPRCKGHV
jgi:ribosomal protein L40E